MAKKRTAKRSAAPRRKVSKTARTRRAPASSRRRVTPSRTQGPEPDDDKQYGDEKLDTLAARAYQEILDRIVNLELEPGRGFTEGELATELKSSKTPVREALLMLRVRGFVFPRPRSGYRVSPITVKDARDLFAILKIIEPECAARCAAKGMDTKRVLLLQDLQSEVDPSDPGSVNEFIEAEISIRRLLAWESENERFYLMSDVLAYDVARLLRLTIKFARPPNLAEDYGKLIGAIARGNAKRAQEMSLHRIELLENFVLGTLLGSDAVEGINVGAPLVAGRA